MKLKLMLLILCLACLSISAEVPGSNEPQDVKNVILLIGDGMGLSQLSSSYYFNNPNEPNFSRFPYIGLIKTSSAKEKVTDSASGATAFACGQKTNNGAISVDVKSRRLETIIERLESRPVSKALVVTSSITHATPAAFYAHVQDRKMEDEIAEQFVHSSLDLAIGGGLKFFNDRKDQKNLLPVLIENGFVWDTVSLPAADQMNEDQKYVYLLANEGMPSKLNGRGDYLYDATQLALNYLARKGQPFFLMVEASQIDWESHYSNVEGVVQEVRDFDKAIGAALDFAEEDGNTLVLVTADHETGGFALRPPMRRKQYKYKQIQGGFYEGSTKLPSAAHTATLIPVLSYGPRAAKFAGIYENTEIFHKIVEITNW